VQIDKKITVMGFILIGLAFLTSIHDCTQISIEGFL